MRTLLFGLIFGLLAIVHSSPVTNVTQIPDKVEDEILQAVTDGFLVDFPGLTTESPKVNTTVPASQQTPSVSGENDFEGSASGDSGGLFPVHVGEHFSTTTTTTTSTTTKTTVAASTQTSTVSGLKDFEGSASGDLFPPHEGEHSTTTTAAPHSTSTVSGVKDFEGSASGDLFPFHDDGHSTTKPTTTTSESSKTTSTAQGENAPEEDTPGESDELSPKDEVHSTTSPTIAAPVGPGPRSRMFGFNMNSASVSGTDDKDASTSNEPQKGTTETHKGHTTPGWIIIVAFIVGLAALIMICVAIATRDKWNGPKQATPPVITTNTTNQQKEQELETFLPKENGKSSEYTIIPLDELPEKDSSD